ncbi:sensor histidine kinase [Flavobacterium granuli]|uniref:histidine kinase n=1 Tax=Flavobacterium granuli TaxID=280093 RepID=A0A1M5NV44_9FLAO|nr:HAMP domain-containing sensor histidine kinase [Flavobacterium granuli]PRZ23399.1 signal transduction histidine kinase [Flavobacterium granuli]SHG93059.1 Signal transduction histidine kinase [Flavobacterium granuli]
MKELSFKNRIASHYIITTALLIFVVFFVIYSIVKLSVYNHVNTDISKEVNSHLEEIEIKNNTFHLIHMKEWEEREHNTVDVNPVFIQFLNKKGEVFEKSPNLKNETLFFDKSIADNVLFDTKILNNKIRQIQVPIFQNDQIIGYLMIAMSLEGASMVLQNLSEILIIAYPLILLILFLIARFIAGRSIKPISAIIETSNIITKDNLKSRILLPQKQDELYVLSQTINKLLDRIETAVERERQFTSDASHELRTPLTVIKGTLEVLVRKPRNQEEYQDKINYCVKEVNRLNNLVDQLLLLARYENQSVQIENISLDTIVLDVISRFSTAIQSKNIQVITQFSNDVYVKSDRYLASTIIENIVSNAIKYSNEKGQLMIRLTESGGRISCHISDTGIGIPKEDLEKIFHPFYRSKSTNHPEIKGTGLGLSIVNRLCKLLNISIVITSEEHIGTQVVLYFD